MPERLLDKYFRIEKKLHEKICGALRRLENRRLVFVTVILSLGSLIYV